jgi:plasmid stability protein
MAMITIRNLDPILKERLRVQAAQRGHSMEAEARRILGVALQPATVSQRNAYDQLRARFAPLGGVDLELPPREAGRDLPDFG